MQFLLADINRRNQKFWRVEQAQAERRMANPLLRDLAMRDLEYEALRHVPIYYRKSLERALQDAEEARRRTLTAFGQKGGRAKRCDLLQELILEIASKTPEVTAPELIDRLKREKFDGVIEDVDKSKIYFIDGKGGSKSAKISGLKDRLSRAKAENQSR